MPWLRFSDGNLSLVLANCPKIAVDPEFTPAAQGRRSCWGCHNGLCRGGNTGVSGLPHSVTSQQELCLRSVDNKYHTLQLSSLINLFYSLCFDLFKDPNFYTLKINRQQWFLSGTSSLAGLQAVCSSVNFSYLLERELSIFPLFGEL